MTILLAKGAKCVQWSRLDRDGIEAVDEIEQTTICNTYQICGWVGGNVYERVCVCVCVDLQVGMNWQKHRGRK